MSRESNSLDLQGSGVEVEQQGVLLARRVQVRLHDCEVDVLDCLYGLELNDDSVFDQEIETMHSNPEPAVEDGHSNLGFESNALRA